MAEVTSSQVILLPSTQYQSPFQSGIQPIHNNVLDGNWAMTLMCFDGCGIPQLN